MLAQMNYVNYIEMFLLLSHYQQCDALNSYIVFYYFIGEKQIIEF